MCDKHPYQRRKGQPTGNIEPSKRAAVPRIQGAFDIEDSPVFEPPSQQRAPGITFTVEQLEAMLAEARKREAALMS